ncbi:putative ankyrin repeat protein RF_0381 [Dreissena polymorpha]|nr:putative ankyrin repeat protein RF_0381 [Dreissena polymorpha]
MDVVRHLCTEYPELLSNQDVNGAHCIHYAARGGHIDALEYLISRGSDPMSTTNAASTILHLAAFDGHLEMANYICDKYPSLLNALDGTGHNVAHYSAGSGNLVLLKLFLSKGIDPLALTTNGSTLLLKAAYSGKLDIIQYICTSFPSTVSSKDEFGCTALHYTTSGGHIKALKYLIKQGMNVMAKTNDGHTVLHMAAYNGHLKIVKFLCESYPDLISMADNGGAYSGEYAKLSENAEIVRYLKSLRRGSNVNRSELGCCKSQSWIGALAQGCSAVLCFCRRN